jgi:hypothetical protein
MSAKTEEVQTVDMAHEVVYETASGEKQSRIYESLEEAQRRVRTLRSRSDVKPGSVRLVGPAVPSPREDRPTAPLERRQKIVSVADAFQELQAENVRLHGLLDAVRRWADGADDPSHLLAALRRFDEGR